MKITALTYNFIGIPLFSQRYSQRLNVFIKELIVSKASVTALREAAVDAGMRSLREDGIEKIKKGITTIEEALRVTFEEEEVRKKNE